MALSVPVLSAQAKPGQALSGERWTGATPEASGTVSAPDGRARWLVFVLLAVTFLVPIALVRYPPVLDLAQQMAQFRLLEEAREDPESVYEVHWWAPNRLSYVLLGAGWTLGGPEQGPRIGLALCLLCVLGSIHYLGAALQRPLEYVVLASLFVWSSSLYGGFFSFLVGSWGIVLWLRELAADPQPTNRAALARAVGITALLFAGHALWLAAAAGILAIQAIFVRETRAHLLVRAVPLASFLALTWAWGRRNLDPAEADRVRYDTPIADRILDPRNWITQPLGGIKSGMEALAIGAVAAIALWTLISWYRGGRRTPSRAARTLAISALAFAAATILLPDLFQETWFLARRWGAWAAVCGTLALPAPRESRRWILALALVLVAAHVASTAAIWARFDEREMRGFELCRRTVPDGSRLLFLDFDRTHPELWVYPTFQMAAYVQLDRNVELSFSFARHRSSLVRFRPPYMNKPWTPRLEHRPREVKPGDFDHFDLALLHLPEWGVATATRHWPRLQPWTGDGEWRLYRVTPGATVP